MKTAIIPWGRSRLIPGGPMLPEGDGLSCGKAHRSEKPSPPGQGSCQNLSPAPLIHAPGHGGAGLDRSHGAATNLSNRPYRKILLKTTCSATNPKLLSLT
jgi:hypothetical protein